MYQSKNSFCLLHLSNMFRCISQRSWSCGTLSQSHSLSFCTPHFTWLCLFSFSFLSMCPFLSIVVVFLFTSNLFFFSSLAFCLCIFTLLPLLWHLNKINSKLNEKMNKQKAYVLERFSAFLSMVCVSPFVHSFIGSLGRPFNWIWFLISFIIFPCSCSNHVLDDFSLIRFGTVRFASVGVELSNIRAHFERKLPDSN